MTDRMQVLLLCLGMIVSSTAFGFILGVGFGRW